MRIVIVGGVAGGMSCAARARRLDESAEIVVLERGAHVSFANCGLPYFVGARSPSSPRSSFRRRHHCRPRSLWTSAPVTR